ncbi:hypothetical protein CYY_010346 [Polysphondylium violaceum]|uniref:RelA/SpoT domain-containing protein n=1 Tax=Polysphondylium violaceum TaxID=133409 RepID=A0A8J4UZU8_9MYCE|nr:hypothetical protein CYY_010346 [Polysphondylium violaceum]
MLDLKIIILLVFLTGVQSKYQASYFVNVNSNCIVDCGTSSKNSTTNQDEILAGTCMIKDSGIQTSFKTSESFNNICHPLFENCYFTGGLLKIYSFESTFEPVKLKSCEITNFDIQNLPLGEPVQGTFFAYFKVKSSEYYSFSIKGTNIGFKYFVNNASMYDGFYQQTVLFSNESIYLEADRIHQFSGAFFSAKTLQPSLHIQMMDPLSKPIFPFFYSSHTSEDGVLDNENSDLDNRIGTGLSSHLKCFSKTTRVCQPLQVPLKNLSSGYTLATNTCTNIYQSLASQFGIGKVSWEQEDYCFLFLHQIEYNRIAKALHKHRIDREHYIERFVTTLESSMKEKGVKAEVSGRPKHIYSIWRKMQKKNLPFDEIFDVRGVRIIVDRLQDCYNALGIIHTLYRHLPDEFDDYISNPKPNGYQSLHTVVLGPNNRTIEIQIRTKQMHQESEMGIASHLKYKKTNISSGNSAHEDCMAWLGTLIA